jgi:competence protein ComEC
MSATILIIFAPDLIYSISFQLSFAATAGVIILPTYLNQQATDLHRCFLKLIPPTKISNPLLQKLKTYLKEESITTLSAQIVVAPLLLNSFGSFSLVAPLTNVLVAWSVPYIMITAFALGLAGMISQVISQIIAVVPLVFTAYFLRVVFLTVSLPHSYFQGIKINELIVLGIYTVLAYLVIKSRDHK